MRPLTLLTLVLLSFAALSIVAFSTTEEDCPCHDRPDTPCVRQRITLEDIVFPAGNPAHDTYLHESGQNSEVWVLVETVPSGACRACAQTYILYAPERDVKSDQTYHLFTADDVSLTCSKVIFSMIECSPASSLAMRIAIIEEDASYGESLELLSDFLSEGLLFAETGDRAAWVAESKGWSARLDGAWLDSLVDRLTVNPGNDIVLPATSIGGPTRTGRSQELNAWNFTGNVDRNVQVKVRSDSTTRVCDLRCSKEDSPTQAESYLAGAKLCDLAASAETARPGYTETTSGPSLPANATKVESSVKRETRTRSDGSKVEYVFIVRVIRFRDGSVYVETYSIKRVIGRGGRATETIRDCLQAAGLRGFDRARIRSLLEVAEQARVAHTLSGGSPSESLSILGPGDAASEIEELPTTLSVVVPSNSALDLSSRAASVAAVQPQIVAWESVTIHADEILLPEGQSLEEVIYPPPQVLPAEDRIVLVAPEAAAIVCSQDRIDVVLANLSGASADVSLTASDTRSWTAPVEREIQLAAGEAAVLTFGVQKDDTGSPDVSSIFTITATASGLPHATRVVELRCVEDGEPASEEATETTAVGLTIPEEIEGYARILAWKGGLLGRTDPSQRWDADENDPGEYCEPCGHTPMCAVCMEWDLGEWQRRRQKSFTDMVALMSLLSYLAEVSGRPEYQAVASVYWDAHWDGWHNRNRPW